MKAKLRSQAWFGGPNREAFFDRSWMRAFPAGVFDDRLLIGICNTYSELTPCKAHLRALADCVKHGLWEAGGFPLELPVMSLGEFNLSPRYGFAITPAWTLKSRFGENRRCRSARCRAIRHSTCNTRCRRTVDAIWISSSVACGPPFHASGTDELFRTL